MLSDEEADAIQNSLGAGSHGPLLVRWVHDLLEDRRERVRQNIYIRKRIEQALTYLAQLCDPTSPSRRDAKARARRYRD
jgi:hypothetical protein